MEALFVSVARAAASAITAAAVVVVVFGAAEAFVGLCRLGVTSSAVHGVRKEIWRRFGTWILLGLEFALAADVITSVVLPTWQDIGQLASIAAIRTFLNFFLERDLEKALASEVA